MAAGYAKSNDNLLEVIGICQCFANAITPKFDMAKNYTMNGSANL